MITIQQSGHLDVVVPPDILNTHESFADESVTTEGGNVQLMCKATGVPEPRLVWKLLNLNLHFISVSVTKNSLFSFIISYSVQWKREDGKDIVIRNEGREKQCNNNEFEI